MAQVPKNDDIQSDRKFDIVIYGATGFTGKIVSIEFAKRYANSDIDFTWAIAGRNENKLKQVRTELQQEYFNQIDTNNINNNNNNNKTEFINNLPIIIADITNKTSLETMISSTTLIMSCIGPYRLVGEPVIETCALYGTHYIDICGEPDFMERCAYKYYDVALDSGAIIVSACGFDSIPSDMGCLFIDQFYTKNKAICSQINGYLTGQAPDGYTAHHTTLKAAVLGMSNANKLRKLRKDISNNTDKDYKIDRKAIIRCGSKHKINKEIYFWSDDVSKYSMLFPFADSAVVTNSQSISSSLINKQGIRNKIFPSYAAYISFNSYWQVLQAVSVGGLSSLLINYKWGRDLIINYPYLMSFGVFSEQGPTKKERKTQTFSFKFYSKGYSKHLCKKLNYDRNELNKLNCDININASVSGSDIAYTGTAKILIECGITLLNEYDNIVNGDVNNKIPQVKGGVFTPSTVFANTTLIDRLNKVGIVFSIDNDNNTDDGDDGDNDDEKKVNDDNDNDNDKNSSDDFEMVNKPNKLNNIQMNNNDNNDNDDDDGDVNDDNAPDMDAQDYDYNKYSNLGDDDVPQ